MKEEKTHHIKLKKTMNIYLVWIRKKNLSYFYIFLNKSYEEVI